jgi:50S ribosomal subunit-associated GTPase HflX
MNLKYADLLLHIIDIADPNWKEHIAVVHQILHELNVKRNALCF